MKQVSFKRFTIFFDQYLFIAITLLSVMGLFFLYSASQGNINVVMKQAIFVGFGIFLMFILSQPDPDIYKILSRVFLITSLILVLITILVAKEINGAKRWLDLGVFTLQPSELVKIALPIYLAAYLFEKPIPIDLKNTFKSLLIIAVCFLLIARQPDLGTSLVVSMAGVYILFFAGLSWKFIGSSIIVFLISLPFLWNNFLQPFQQQRILTSLDPSADPFGSGWNITQSKIAIGSGGISGKGFEAGSQSHLDFLPETETDFIFAVIAEEFGFIGVCILLSIYMFIFLRCMYLAFNARDRFCRLTIGGLSLIFASTLFINLAMVTGLIPVVGMPLPFISKGGSSLLSFYIAFGIIISMASHKKLMQR
ncbi:rod shape-determining protein RodA [Gammaproteobacteria bacterium]|nr:rod shape-determining protein RodA [Gammaproteobacteria bacterium]MDA9011276.1 rod shape-determining protein RodA [Gammaproteobacteria bacterium]MDA9024277.1 rod shape-determining protein RodA [Gammaproteobacteria bacterium]MDA9038541.1 rod shape-determining protein RodA [Gammaproteobacteria bacterium]MDA9044426.1 rod shape-determining protein RodA [Gammaproteobacteria bacterium]|tara:strand:+ start:12484 stop:13581 length:1098 start_codon:yes stop_codon:yes gene_type:complete